MFKIDNNSEEFLTRTLITEYSNRFETSRYADDYQGEVEDIIKDFAEVQHKEPCVVKKGGYYGVYHELLDTMLVPVVYEELQAPHPDLCFDLGYFIVRRGGKYGIVRSDVVGTEIYPCICDKIVPCGYYKCIIEVNGLQGFVQVTYGCSSVVELIPAEYDNISGYDGWSEYLQLCKDGKVGLYGAQLPIPPIYDGIYIPKIVGWIKVKSGGRWGYIDCQGNFTDDVDKAFLYVCSRDPYATLYIE